MVDSRGNLLARAGQPTGPAAAAQSGEELKRATELRLSRAVEEMLERSLGAGRVRAEAAVELDFDQVRETQERFDPEGQVIRSQQSSTDNSRNTEASPSVSVQNNLPNADAGAQPTGSQEQKQEETTNYEISKTVRTLVREQPQLRRITIAVMVDGVAARGTDGTPSWNERSPEELARIATLVRSAIGYNEARGDRVDVVTMRFAAPEDTSDAAPTPVWARLDKADLFRLAETGLIALAVLAGLLFVLRPMALRLSVAPKTALAGAAGDASALAGTKAAGHIEGGEEMVQMANIDGAMRMSSIRRVSELVDARSDDSLAMLRSWLTAEAN
jgi:flagellar M-ring protein FliF